MGNVVEGSGDDVTEGTVPVFAWKTNTSVGIVTVPGEM
jgi:hypothetical protein